ncbi:MAG TPA: alpha/beta hydrolase [Polyangiaceae bacterium]|jgi:pimeloyl-ACP methyl ester carboxylesterase|nr:alpha/beta hydrolase [Polyangiaceae bacterium]
MSSLPIAFLPGGGGRSSYWRPVADRLWRHGAPMVFGYPGFGDVPAEPSLPRLDDYFRALLATLPDRFHLVAQSMGNVLALRMAFEHPERVASLTSCAPSGGIDVLSLGAAQWRPLLGAEQPATVPRWFYDDASDFTMNLGSIVAPTLVLTGDADPLSPPAVGAFLRDRIPASTLHVLRGGTHTVAYDEPDRVAALIGTFLGSLAR